MARVFRVFLSSTFMDWAVERDHLRNHVFPDLTTWVEEQAREKKVSARFLPVDLRWGVSEEAGKTHTTVDICLEEVRRCQEKANRPSETIKPNFMVFIGQRYGWRPVPPKISQDYWQELDKLGVIDDLFLKYYQEDLNADPSEYVLKAVEGDPEAPEGSPQRNDWEEWQTAEKELRAKLDDSYLSGESEWREKFTVEELAFLVGSVTEQEIVRGAFEAAEAEKHVHIFSREIENPPAEFLSDDELISSKLLGQLKKDLKDRGYTIHNYQLESVPVQGDDYLEQFGNDVRKALETTIEGELEELASSDEIHQADAPDLDSYVERPEQDAIRKWDGTKPILVYGEAGTGKSILLSKAAAETKAVDIDVYTYWIGRDARCASGMGLLQAMLEDLYALNKVKESEEFKMDELASMNYQKVEGVVKETLANLDSSIRMIIDAVDQLPERDPARDLGWLSADAPVLLSTLDEKQMDQYCSIVSELSVVHVRELGDDKSEELLGKWFKSLRTGARTLQKDQKKTLLTEYNGRPLHLRVLFERAISLRSFDGVPEWLGAVKQPTEDAIRDFYDYLSREEEHGDVMVKRTLAYLTSSPLGVPEDVLLTLLRNDDEVVEAFKKRSPNSPDVGKDRLPEVVWSRLYHDLEPFLARRSLNGEAYLDFYHAQFRRTISESDAPWVEKDVIQQCREKIDALASEPENLDRPGKANEPVLTPTLRNFLYRHATDNAIELGGENVHVAAERLTNFSYLMARLESLAVSEVTELMEEYRLLEKYISVSSQEETKWRDWSRFMQSNAHLLTSGDELWPAYRILLQLGVEHADDSPITKQVEEWLNVDGNCDWLWMRSASRPEHYVPDPCLSVLEGHTKEVKNVFPLPNGRALSLSDDKSLRFWELESAQCQQTLEDAHSIKRIDGHRILIIGKRTLRVWNIVTSDIEYSLNVLCDIRDAMPVSDNRALIIYEVQLDEDGVRISSDSFNLQIWDVGKGSCEHILRGHLAPVAGVILLPEGRAISWCISTDGSNTYDDDTLRLWDMQSGECLQILEGERKGSCPSWLTLDELSDSSVIVWGGDMHGLPILFHWELKSGRKELLNGHDSPLAGVFEYSRDCLLSWCGAYSPEEDDDHRLLVWDLKTGTCVHELKGHQGGIQGVHALLDDRALSWSRDGTIRIWAMESGQCLNILEGHTDSIKGVCMLPNGQVLSSSTDSTLRLWDTVSGSCLRVFNGHDGPIDGFQLLTDHRVLSWSEDKTLCLWNFESGECLGKYTGHTSKIIGTYLLSDNQLLSWGVDCSIRLWNLNLGKPLSISNEYKVNLKDTFFISDERVLSCSIDGRLQYWNTESGTCEREFKTSISTITGMELLGNNRIIIKGTESIQVLNVENATLEKSLIFSAQIAGVKPFSDDQVMIWFWDDPLQIWDLKQSECKHVLKGSKGPVDGVSLLPKDRAATWSTLGSGDCDIRIWDLKTGKCLQILKGFEDPPNGVSVISDTLLLTWSYVNYGDHSLRLYDFESGCCLNIMTGHQGAIGAIHLLSDGRLLSWCGESCEGQLHSDFTIRLWNPYAGGCLHVLSGHQGEINGLCEVAGDQIISWSRDRTLRVWSLESGECIHTLEGHSSGVNRVLLLKEGLILSWANELILWNLNTGSRVSVAHSLSEEIDLLHQCDIEMCHRNGKYQSVNSVLSTDGKHLLIWFGNSPSVKEKLLAGERFIVDGGDQVKVLHVWEGNCRISVDQ